MKKQIKTKVHEFVEQLLEKLPFKTKELNVDVRKEKLSKKAEENAEETEEPKEIYVVDVNFITDSPELVIGYHGKNLNAFRTVLQTFLNMNFPDENVRVNLDIDNYFKEKLERLEKRVRQSIEEVRLLQEPVELKPMSPKYRRHVHIIVAEADGVYSESKGEGRSRRVVIYPNEETKE